MPEEKFASYDSADYLKTEADIAAYLEAVMEDGRDDHASVARALGVIARVQNLSQVELSNALEAALIKGEESGKPQPFDFETFKARKRAEYKG